MESVLDRGRPSLRHRVLVSMLQLAGVAKKGDLETILERRDHKAASAAPAARLLRGVDAREDTTAAGWPMWVLRPKSSTADRGRVIVAVHGGGYYDEVNGMHYQVYADLVRRTGATVVVPIYPLIPQGTAAVVVPQMAQLITDLVTRHGAANVGVVSESAGSGLALAACQHIVQHGQAVPGRMVLISPWLDVTIGDERSRAIREPMLNSSVLREAGRRWAGELPPAHPLVSPLFGSLMGLPATSVFSGTLDVLHPDAQRLQEKAFHEGVPMRFHFGVDLTHAGYVISVFPEYKEALARIIDDLDLAERPAADR